MMMATPANSVEEGGAVAYHPVRGHVKRVKTRVFSTTPEVVDNKELTRFNLGNRRYVVVCLFKGELKVHVREYSYGDRPTLKGICLTPSRWVTLVSRIDLLEEGFTDPMGDMSHDEGEHLGGNVYAKASSEYKTVDIRQYFIPEGGARLLPTRRGIRLTNFEWENLARMAGAICNSSPELANAIPCCLQLDHSNYEGFQACRE